VAVVTTADHWEVAGLIFVGGLAAYLAIGGGIGVAILLGRWVESHNRTRRNP
jgi:hypothetical protein